MQNAPSGALVLTFIKLPFSTLFLYILEWPLTTGFTVTQLSKFMRVWCISHIRAAKVQTRVHKYAQLCQSVKVYTCKIENPGKSLVIPYWMCAHLSLDR